MPFIGPPFFCFTARSFLFLIAVGFSTRTAPLRSHGLALFQKLLNAIQRKKPLPGPHRDGRQLAGCSISSNRRARNAQQFTDLFCRQNPRLHFSLLPLACPLASILRLAGGYFKKRMGRNTPPGKAGKKNVRLRPSWMHLVVCRGRFQKLGAPYTTRCERCKEKAAVRHKTACARITSFTQKFHGESGIPNSEPISPRNGRARPEARRRHYAGSRHDHSIPLSLNEKNLLSPKTT